MTPNFNFKDTFIEKVLSGEKPGSIRLNKKCDVGDNIQLLAGKRTKNSRVIGHAICTGVAKIRITDDSPWSLHEIEGEIKTSIDDKPFHEIEGFESNRAMMEFFRKLYGLPFNGYYHQWRIIKDDENE